MFAARAAGSEPPITNPKNRGPAVASVAGEQSSSSSASTAAGSIGSSCKGRRSSSRRATAAGDGATGLDPTPSR